MHAYAADRVEHREPGKTFAVRVTWALGSRELGELTAESVVKPITDSNLCLRAPAQRPAIWAVGGRLMRHPPCAQIRALGARLLRNRVRLCDKRR